MAYVSPNFKTKKALREAVAAGRQVFVWQPGPYGDRFPSSGTCTVEGPHYPERHRWYARVVYRDEVVISVR